MKSHEATRNIPILVLTVVEGLENLRPLGVEVLWGGAKDILFEQT